MGAKRFNECLLGAKDVNIRPFITRETIFQEKSIDPYSGLALLSHVATVDEVRGVFRMTVSSTTSPKCIRKNTDTPHETQQNLIILGFDNEIPGLFRGPQRSGIVKHKVVLGISGYAKLLA